MQNFKEFLDKAFEPFEDQRKLRRFYLYAMTKDLEKSFIIDLMRLFPRLLTVEETLKESLNIIEFFVQDGSENNISNLFNSYLVK
jgi:hypothetical protein